MFLKKMQIIYNGDFCNDWKEVFGTTIDENFENDLINWLSEKTLPNGKTDFLIVFVECETVPENFENDPDTREVTVDVNIFFETLKNEKTPDDVMVEHYLGKIYTKLVRELTKKSKNDSDLILVPTISIRIAIDNFAWIRSSESYVIGPSTWDIWKDFPEKTDSYSDILKGKDSLITYQKECLSQIDNMATNLQALINVIKNYTSQFNDQGE